MNCCFESFVLVKTTSHRVQKIQICASNLNWIENFNERELPLEGQHLVQNDTCHDDVNVEDKGPLGHIIDEGNLEETYGVVPKFFVHAPKEKDTEVLETLKEAVKIDNTNGKQVRF